MGIYTKNDRRKMTLNCSDCKEGKLTYRHASFYRNSYYVCNDCKKEFDGEIIDKINEKAIHDLFFSFD